MLAGLMLSRVNALNAGGIISKTWWRNSERGAGEKRRRVEEVIVSLKDIREAGSGWRG